MCQLRKIWSPSESIAESEKERDQAKIEMECFHKLMYFPGLVGLQDYRKADHQAVCRKIHHCRLSGSKNQMCAFEDLVEHLGPKQQEALREQDRQHEYTRKKLEEGSNVQVHGRVRSGKAGAG